MDAGRHGDRAGRRADADLKAAAAKDTQEKSTVEASMAKLAASEAAHKAADKAMQILASAGYRRGSVVERLFRDVRATEIYQGTSEAQRMIIAANVLAYNRVIGSVERPIEQFDYSITRSPNYPMGGCHEKTEPPPIRSDHHRRRRRRRGRSPHLFGQAPTDDDAEERQAGRRRLEQRQQVQERRQRRPASRRRSR